jgi:hypothetical protein
MIMVNLLTVLFVFYVCSFPTLIGNSGRQPRWKKYEVKTLFFVLKKNAHYREQG